MSASPAAPGYDPFAFGIRCVFGLSSACLFMPFMGTAIRIATTLGPSGFGAPLLWPQLTPGHSLFSHSAFFASLTGPPGVRHTSFVRQPPDLPSRLYVYPLGFGLFSNLTRRLALYQVSVRRLLDFVTPLPPLLALLPAACGSLRLAVNTRDRTFTG